MGDAIFTRRFSKAFELPRNYTLNGLILDLDTFYPDSYSGSGTTWQDLSGVMGNVNVQNRSLDWSFVNDSGINLKVLRNTQNRTSSPGINIPMNNGFNKQTGTLELWIKPEINYTGGHGWFVNSDGNGWTNDANWYWIGTWENSILLYVRHGNSSTCCNDLTISSFQNSYPLNVWQHWVVTWNTPAGTRSIYKNGVLVTSGSVPTNVTNTNPTTTGQMFNGHTRTDNMQFKGSCSVYRMYNRPLTLAEIQTNFNETRTRFNI
jgi:hypothetical protein